MVHELHMSFKRVKFRPTCINLKTINDSRSLFAFKFLKDFSPDILILNDDDESSLNRSIKTHYSWE